MCVEGGRPSGSKYFEHTEVPCTQTGGGKINFRYDAPLSKGNDGNLAEQQPPRKSLNCRTAERKLWAPMITVAG